MRRSRVYLDLVLFAVLGAASYADTPVLYDFESSAENWNEITTPTVISVSQTGLYASHGSGSLQSHFRLDRAAGQKDAEIGIMHPCDLDGRILSADVLFPFPRGDMPAGGLGVRVFVKDGSWRSEYGPWINVCDIQGPSASWYDLCTTVSAGAEGHSYMDEGFNPHDVVLVGIQVSITTDTVCDETFYVDAVSFAPNARPVPPAHTLFAFNELTPELQSQKPPLSPHRPFWSCDPAWNAQAWDDGDITVALSDDGKALSIAADLTLSTTDTQDVNYPGRKGFIRATFFPNFDLAVTDNRVLRAEIKFDPYVAPGTVEASWFLFDRRSTSDWVRGVDKPVGGAQWNVLACDLSDADQVTTSTTWPREDEYLKEILFAGIQFYANAPYQGTIYIDNITLGGEICTSATLAPVTKVTRRGSCFWLDGQAYFFAGANNFYPFYKSHYMIDDLFDTLASNGIEVFRTWGFCDGLGRCVADGDGIANGNEECSFQPWAGIYDRLTLENFDYVVYSARKHNVRLIVPLVNYWSDNDVLFALDDPTSGVNAFGGVGQYLEWAGLVPQPGDYVPMFDGGGHIASYSLNPAFKLPFYTSETLKTAYKNYVSTLLSRTNIYTGETYANEPAIFAWELANEPRGTGDATGNALYNWAAEMSAFVKGPACNATQLVSIGDEGMLMGSLHPEDPFYNGSYGVDWERNLGIGAIDFATMRLYPDHWNKDMDWISSWLEAHEEIAQRIRKPLVVEEYGLWRTHLDRVTRYQQWMQSFYVGYTSGDLLWMVAGRVNNENEDDPECEPWLEGYYPDYDGFTIWEMSPEFAALREHAAAMREKRPPLRTRHPLNLYR